MARITYGDGKILQPTSKEALKENIKFQSAKRDAESVKRSEYKEENLPKTKVKIYAPIIEEFAKKNSN